MNSLKSVIAVAGASLAVVTVAGCGSGASTGNTLNAGKSAPGATGQNITAISKCLKAAGIKTPSGGFAGDAGPGGARPGGVRPSGGTPPSGGAFPGGGELPQGGELPSGGAFPQGGGEPPGGTPPSGAAAPNGAAHSGGFTLNAKAKAALKSCGITLPSQPSTAQ